MSAPTPRDARNTKDPRLDRRGKALGVGIRVAWPVDRVAWAVLVLAMAASAALILALNHGTTFFTDEVRWLGDVSADPSLSTVIEPHNGHLNAVTRLIYLITLETVGAEYLVFRLLGVFAVLLAAGLFFVLAKRRIGPLAALAPAIVLLFLGSAWQHVVVPIGFTVIFSIAAGLGALIALERRDLRGDVGACALLCLSVATFSVGLAFLVGAAITILLEQDRRRRIWVFGAPLALYAVWWLWAMRFDERRTQLSNVVEIPSFVGESLAVVAGALTGVNYPFADTAGFEALSGSASVLGWIAGALLVVLVVARIRRGNVPTSLWAALGILLTYWVAAAMATDDFTDPAAVRFVYPGSIGVLLVAAAAARDMRIGPRALAAVAAVLVFSLAMNLAFLRDGAALFREVYSPMTRAQFTAVELAAGHTVPGSDLTPEARPDAARPALPAQVVRFNFPLIDTDDYLASIERYGSLADPLPVLRQESLLARDAADRALAAAYALRLTPSSAQPGRRGCRTLAAPGQQPVVVEIPSSGAGLNFQADAPAEVAVRRFGDSFAGPAGALRPGEPSSLLIPGDAAPDPWEVSILGATRLVVCSDGGQ